MTQKHTSKGGTNITKDVIYIDVDDEITAIIDKVHASDKKIVALVLPKRAAVLQSIVNMKLLKRAAVDAKKHLVLITSEHALIPLAGSVGIHVAKSLNSKPEIPDPPLKVHDGTEPEDDEPEDIVIDPTKPVGELAAQTDPQKDDDTGPIELDNADRQADKSVAKAAKGKKFKIPDFNKFRLVLIFSAVGVIVLSVVGYAAVAVWPTAKITIQTDSQAVTSSTVLALKTTEGAELDAEKAVVPAQIQEVTKTLTQEAPATGELNKGEKATGTVVMTVKDCPPYNPNPPSDVPAGSGISSSGKTYITQKKAVFSLSAPEGSCIVFKTDATAIVAQTGGSSFNVTSATFTIPGRSDVTATGSASGGTDNIVKVVSQADIDSAKEKITQQDTASVRQELKSALVGRNLFPIEMTFTTGEPETSVSAEVNTEAETVTVTQTITYTMVGAKQEDLEKVIAENIKEKIDSKKQSVLSYGLDDAFFALQNITPEETTVSMQATVVAGASLNVDAIKKQVAGKKAGDAKEIILANPGVTNVTVEYGPFWVSSIPKKIDKITVVIQEPRVTEDNE
ncbi:hypothetical protein IRY61_04340, partial [Candidatus Saccharibacteria bacterium]|nr:hypothetical protein [Candidatus Saccharibacteria bacterium]